MAKASTKSVVEGAPKAPPKKKAPAKPKGVPPVAPALNPTEKPPQETDREKYEREIQDLDQSPAGEDVLPVIGGLGGPGRHGVYSDPTGTGWGPICVDDVDCLQKIAESATAMYETVAAAVNPLSPFALQYKGLAECTNDLIKLIGERGHTGVPSNG